MTKKERKLLKAADQLEQITKEYLEKLMELDKVFQNTPTRLSRALFLEERYFKHVPKIAVAAVQLELLSSRLQKDFKDPEEDFTLEEPQSLESYWQDQDLESEY